MDIWLALHAILFAHILLRISRWTQPHGPKSWSHTCARQQTALSEIAGWADASHRGCTLRRTFQIEDRIEIVVLCVVEHLARQHSGTLRLDLSVCLLFVVLAAKSSYSGSMQACLPPGLHFNLNVCTLTSRKIHDRSWSQHIEVIR